MQVKPWTAMHEISSTVTTASGTPVNDATIAIGDTSAVKTDPTGHYQWWYTSADSQGRAGGVNVEFGGRPAALPGLLGDGMVSPGQVGAVPAAFPDISGWT
jgi:hypothetical protein